MRGNKKLNRAAAVLCVLVLAVIFATVGMLFHFDTESQPEHVHVGVILTGSRNDHGWNSQHFQGVSTACKESGVTLLVEENIPEGNGLCAEAAQRLLDQGAQLILLASYKYSMDMADFISAHPEVSFYCISPEQHAENLSSYFCRIYQGRYLAGILAGMQSKTGKIGYIAAMPNNEVNRGLSAFVLGVRKVNPDAVVKVAWTNSWDDQNAETRLTNQLIAKCDVDVISYHQNQAYVAEAADAAGVQCIGYNEAAVGLSDKYLTAVVTDWAPVYRIILRRLLQGNANKDLDIWIGMEAHAVALSHYSPLVTEDAKQAVETARKAILSGSDVFSGEIYDTSGVKQCESGETIGDESLMYHFDWYAEGVEFYEE